MYFASEMDRKWRPSNKNRNVIGHSIYTRLWFTVVTPDDIIECGWFAVVSPVAVVVCGSPLSHQVACCRSR